MNTISLSNPTRVNVPAGMNELVRGTDHLLVAQLAPMVREQDAVLDLASVHRIDAAGIAALISLYHCARESGHTFSVCNVEPRIDSILHLVGLEHILVAQDAALPPAAAACLHQSAA